jgi:hypothetical protein
VEILADLESTFTPSQSFLLLCLSSLSCSRWCPPAINGLVYSIPLLVPRTVQTCRSCEKEGSAQRGDSKSIYSLANAQRKSSDNKKLSSSRQPLQESHQRWRTIQTTAMVQTATAFSSTLQEAMIDSSKMTALTPRRPRHFPSQSFHRVKRSQTMHSRMQQLLLLQLAIS